MPANPRSPSAPQDSILTPVADGLLTGAADGIGWIVFDNPGRHNAMTPTMAAGLPEAAHRLATDETVGVVIIRGRGERAFMSGADINTVGELGAQRTPHASMQPPDKGAGLGALQRLDKPVIALIHGWCLGGGLLVALTADIRIAADDAAFGIPAAKLGAGYPYDAVRTLVTLVGPANTSEILFSGERFDADQALRIGLINRVVAKTDVDQAVLTLAASIGANAPLTVRAAKTAIRHAVLDPAERDVGAVRAAVAACFESDDFAEGRQAFLEKRAPRFSGR